MAIIESAETKEIFEALKKVIDIPDNVVSLELTLDAENPPVIRITKIAEKAEKR